MPVFQPEEADYARCKHGTASPYLKKEKFDSFGPQVLGIGDLGAPSVEHEIICAMFDLEGFTDFCRQIDPHLALPEFLRQFVDWLFESIKKHWVLPEEKVLALEDPVDGAVITWAPLPILSKFTGDGVMFLWDACKLSPSEVASIASLMLQISSEYVAIFLPKISKNVSYAPERLRCGVARGKAYAIGNGSDYVGPCINIAARLQKTAPGITVTISRRGFPQERWSKETGEALILKKLAIRGIGNEELVFVQRSEFEKLDPESQRVFREP